MTVVPPRMLSHVGRIVAAQVVSAFVAFVTTPVIALGLGAEQYGLYTLLFVFLGYSTALDFGLSLSLVKHIAEYDPQSQKERIESLTDTATTVYAAIGGAFVLALVLGRSWIVRTLLHVPAQLATTAENAAVILACSVPFTTAMTVFGSLFRGLLRFEYVALFSVVNASVYSVCAAILVSKGASLEVIVALYAGVTAASAGVQWAVLRKLLPGFRLLPRLDRERLRQLFSFGSFMMLNQFGRLALLHLDRLVITRVLSVSMAGYYAVPFAIGQRLNLVGAAAATVAFPHSSASTARGELDDFRQQHLQSARVVAWLTLAPTLTVIVLADQILTYWMSPEFAVHGTWPLRVLAFGMMWISVASIDAVSIEGAGRPWVTSVFLGITGVVNIVGLLVLTPTWGLGGAAASVTLSLLALATLDVWYCNKNVIRSPLRVWVRSVMTPAMWTTLLSLPIALLLRGGVAGLPSLILVAFSVTGFTGAMGYWFFLSMEDRRWVKARIEGLWTGKKTAHGD